MIQGNLPLKKAANQQENGKATTAREYSRKNGKIATVSAMASVVGEIDVFSARIVIMAAAGPQADAQDANL